MNIRLAKLDWQLADPIIHSDDFPHCLIVKIAQNGCGEAFINPCDHNMGFLLLDSHYVACLRDTLNNNHWFDVPPEHCEPMISLARNILDYIEQHPSADGSYCFLVSDEF